MSSAIIQAKLAQDIEPVRPWPHVIVEHEHVWLQLATELESDAPILRHCCDTQVAFGVERRTQLVAYDFVVISDEDAEAILAPRSRGHHCADELACGYV